jgi:hypothetical protein
MHVPREMFILGQGIVSFVLHTSVRAIKFSHPACGCPVIGVPGYARCIVQLAQRAGTCLDCVPAKFRLSKDTTLESDKCRTPT